MGQTTFLKIDSVDITARQTDIESEPWKISQSGRGNCGLAATLMAIHDNFAESKVKQAYLELKNTVYKGDKFDGVLNSEKIKERISRRYTSNYAFTSTNPDEFNLDYDVCTGMSILLKEWLRNSVIGGKDIWHYNLLYSDILIKILGKVWSSNPMKAKTGLATPGANTKHGDVALSAFSLTELLKLMKFNANEQIIKQNLSQVVANHKANKWDKTTNQELLDYVKAETTVKGAIAGVAKQQSRGKPNAEVEDYIVHWVYIPKSEFGQQRAEDTLEVWNWGKKTNLKALGALNQEFIVVKVLPIKPT